MFLINLSLAYCAIELAISDLSITSAIEGPSCFAMGNWSPSTLERHYH
ncbi:hypothetical protein GGR08_001659 [Bartonella fuyuanensis]|uniref:Uncharacterized protein n=1 Tax=Bartonella fuyuanensis TaxID=1460968 RepID=A0A840E5D2_9HYPH|nr:hypothetical protein [Bartonella fuyuanensis]